MPRAEAPPSWRRPCGLALLSPVLGSRYGGKNSPVPGWLFFPLDAGEHWSEQAKPKGIGRDADAFTREAGKPRV